MSLTTAKIQGIVSQAQRAVASYMLTAVRKEAQGEDCHDLYLKSRYLSAGIRILSASNLLAGRSKAITGIIQQQPFFSDIIIIAGDFAAEILYAGKISVIGSTGNDGTYTVTATSFAAGLTQILVAEVVPSAVANGTINYSAIYNYTLTIAEAEKILHCMIESGDMTSFSTTPFVVPSTAPIIIGTNRIIDLTDGPMGSLAGVQNLYPRVNPSGTAWIWDVAQSAVNVDNVTFVSKAGNDTTGLVERLDLPFLTIAAARTALLLAYTGPNAPSATNRKLIKVLPGTYLEGIVLADFVDFDLTDSVIDMQAASSVPTASFGTIDDGGVSCNSVVYGYAHIKRTTSGTAGAIRTLNAGTVLTVHANVIESDRAAATVLCTNGTQFINCRKVFHSTNDETALCSSGYQQIVASQLISDYGLNTNIACRVTSGEQVLEGEISAGVDCQGGIQRVLGNILNNGATCSGGTQTVKGNVASGTTSAATCTAGSQNITGDITQTGAVGAFHGCECGGTGLQVINGNIAALSSIGNGILYSSSGLSIYSSESISSLEPALNQSSGTIRINVARLSATGINKSAIRKSGGTLILNNCTLIKSGTGFSITTPSAQSVKIYGTCQADEITDPAFLVTEQVASIIVDPLVT